MSSHSPPSPRLSFVLSSQINSPEDLIAGPASRDSPTLVMPPPAHTTMFAPPPPPTFSINQLLAHTPETPSPPSGASAIAIETKRKRPTHNSSAPSDKYAPISDMSLREIPPLLVAAFRGQISSIDSIRLNSPMTLPWDASPMLSSGSVTSYLDAQVLIAAWQAVSQMLPNNGITTSRWPNRLAYRYG